MPLKTRSYLLNSGWLTEQQRQRKRSEAEQLASDMYTRRWGSGARIARALLPSDFNVVTVEEWQETTGASIDAWNASTVASGAAQTRDNTVIALYGIQPIALENEAGVYAWGAADVSPPVTAVRVLVGGARVAQYDLSFLIKAMAQTADLATGSEVYGNLNKHDTGYMASPLVIVGPKTVEIDYWEVTASLDFQIAWLGVVVEAAGGQGGITAPSGQIVGR